MLAILPVILGVTLIAGVCVFAIVMGGAAERLGAICIIAANAVAEFVMLVSNWRYSASSIFVIDFILAICLLLVAIRFGSLWLGAAMILQGIALCAHALIQMGDEIPARIHLYLNNSLTYLMLGCIMLGTLANIRRRRRNHGFTPAPDSISPAQG